MLSLQETGRRLRLVSDTAFSFLPNGGTVKYGQLEQHDNVNVASGLGSGTFVFWLKPKSYRSLCTVIGALLAIVFTLLAAESRNDLTIESSVSSPDTSWGPRVSIFEHPVSQLVKIADAQIRSRRAAQSRTLHEAIEEYKRRHGMPPPPHFDKWYDFAAEHETELIDEYDTIYESLILFWAMSPAIIRGRTLEALGHDNSLMGVSIRGGEVRVIGPGQDNYQAQATMEMIAPFSQWLPDMDIAFNVNDEPRVIVPHEDVDRLMSLATENVQSVRPLNDSFTRPDDMSTGESYDLVSETRFNELGLQQTWAYARMSCPPDTPARSFDPDIKDANVYFSFGGINFVQNTTMFSDVCLTPSVREVIGLFNHPNVLSVSHDLIPVFSPSKLSTFHDILYPSPYYYADRTAYDQQAAVPWDYKNPKLYWRGATSGGYSEGGTWRKLLRQSILSKLASPGTVRLLSKGKENQESELEMWTTKEVPGSDVAEHYDAKFTEIKQCDPDDCVEMDNYFGVYAHAPQEESWQYRYLLDMDGNALSGRFYALLKSLSLPLKVAYYREWHSPRIFPWKHYVPLSATTDEYAEVLRYFEQEEEGMEMARDLAVHGRDWAGRTLRKVDMEVYMFRLLLEYGRLVDDNRSELGYHE